MKRKRTYRLDPALITKARRILRTTTDTATIERALDLVVFGEELSRWGERARRRRLDVIDPEEAERG